MRICLICVEIFAWGKYGGFGRATRTIGRELAKRGVEVFAVTPRQPGQHPVEELDGIKVLSFPPSHFWSSKELYRQCRADLYHSNEPSLGTYLAMQAMPHSKHMITMRDPRDFGDWMKEYELPSMGKLQVLSNYFYENNFLVHRAVRKADRIFCTANFLIPKVKQIYQLSTDPHFLPTPVSAPDTLTKATTPTVCYMGRWDRRKRPELFFRLAKAFPHVRFIAAGISRDKTWDQYLRNTYSQIPNLEMTGFVDQFNSDMHSVILEKSWVMVNTASREGLPNAFLEAAANGCAILSTVNPGQFASDFGCHVEHDRLGEGLEFLLGESKMGRDVGTKAETILRIILR